MCRCLTTSSATLSVATPAWASGLSWGFPNRTGRTSTSPSVHSETASFHNVSGLWPFTSWYTPARVARGPEDGGRHSVRVLLFYTSCITESVVVILTNFLWVMMLAIPSSPLPHDTWTCSSNQQTQSRKGSCSLCVHEQTEAPLNGVLCPDWIKWAEIPENVFPLLLHVRHVLLTKHSITMITVRI